MAHEWQGSSDGKPDGREVESPSPDDDLPDDTWKLRCVAARQVEPQSDCQGLVTELFRLCDRAERFGLSARRVYELGLPAEMIAEAAGKVGALAEAIHLGSATKMRVRLAREQAEIN